MNFTSVAMGVDTGFARHNVGLRNSGNDAVQFFIELVFHLVWVGLDGCISTDDGQFFLSLKLHGHEPVLDAFGKP